MVFDHRHLLPSKLGITEHMTDHSRKVISKPRELIGYNLVKTRDCKVIVELFGRGRIVSSISDVQKLFACYCQFLGLSDSPPYIPPTSNTATTTTVRSYADVVKQSAKV